MANEEPIASQNITARQKPGWEREVLEKLLLGTLKEQRARRRWTIFFRLLTLVIIGFLVWLALGFKGGSLQPVGRHTALIDIDGAIGSSGTGSAEAVLPALRRAYDDKSAAGILLRINSPGGSPVQAGIINDEITRLRALHPNKPLHVVVTEMCASGGYYIAVAADRIYVDKASIVGSIGVRMDSFGVTGLMEKLGVERRLLTAGDHKAFMDPFSPESEEDVQHAQSMLNEIHQQFIRVVRNGRGDRLKETPEMFSGLFWSGERAVALGLADEFGTVDSIARNVIKAEKVVDYTQRDGLSDRMLKKFGVAVGNGAVSSAWSNAGPRLQ